MKRVLIMLADGFEEVESLTVVDYLRRSDIICDTTAITNERIVEGAHNIAVKTDKILDEINTSNGYDGLVLPGGMPGAANLRDDERVINLIREFNRQGKLVGAICAAPIVLQKAGIIDGKQVTSYPGFENELRGASYSEELVVQDENIITARGPAVAVYFAVEIVEYLCGKEVAKKLKEDILLDMVEKKVRR